MAKRDSMARLVLVLFVITAITAVLLGVVNAVTADRIAEIGEEKRNSAMEAVMPGAGGFEEYRSGDDHTVYKALGGDGAVIGYVVEVAPVGFGGAINMVVGFDLEKKISGVSIVSMSETAGLGEKVVSEPWFLEQFTGKSGELAIKRDVDAISGATVSSKAVLSGVNTAVSAIEGE